MVVVYKKLLIISSIVGIGLICLLAIGIQGVLVSEQTGPETISCAEDELPNEFQGGLKKERIFFHFDTGGLSGPHEEKVQAFDISQKQIEDIVDVLEWDGLPHISPLGTYFFYLRHFGNDREGEKNTTYYQPIIRTVDANNQWTVPVEITRDDSIRWSPDGKCLIILHKQTSEMSLYHLSNGQYDRWSLPNRLGLSQVEFLSGSISPNGRWLAGACGEKLCIMKMNGDRVATISANVELGFNWSPDGRYLLVREGEWQLSYLDAGSGWTKHPLVNSTNCQQNCGIFQDLTISAWAPDSTRLAGRIQRPDYHPLIIIDFPSGDYRFLGETLRYPTWSPQSNRLAVTELSEAYLQPAGIYIIDLDGTKLEVVKKVKQTETARTLFWTEN